MEQKTNSAKFLRQRKFLLVLPLLVLPFVLLVFLALGGGKGSSRSGTNNTYALSGLNTKLPEAHFKKGLDKDKIGAYEQAVRDSDRIKEAIKNDPYYRLEKHDSPEASDFKTNALQSILERAATQYNQPSLSRLKTSPGTQTRDPNEEKVMAKLAILNKALSNKDGASFPRSGNTLSKASPENPDMQKLENLIKLINVKKEPDPEIKQLTSLLDKILLVQHPKKIKDSLRIAQSKDRPQALPVLTSRHDQELFPQNFQDSGDQQIGIGFYGLSDQSDQYPSNSNTIAAIIEGTQTLVSGAVVKIRLLQDVYIQGTPIPKDQLIYGTCNLSNERLKITIHAILSEEKILPVALEVYDLDGLEGIYIPGSINRDVSKESADQAMSSLGIFSLDPSLGAQAANAGIQTAKSLMSKKIKLVKVTIKAGYLVLLKDNSQQ
jgi:conjugative transposon TraM protein